jgi:hypothetical protein
MYPNPVSGSWIPQSRNTENPQNYTGNVNVSQPSLTHFKQSVKQWVHSGEVVLVLSLHISPTRLFYRYKLKLIQNVYIKTAERIYANNITEAIVKICLCRSKWKELTKCIRLKHWYLLANHIFNQTFPKLNCS